MVEEIQATTPSGENTPLGGAVLAILDDLRRRRTAAIVVLSDGINTDGPSALRSGPIRRTAAACRYS